MSQVVKMRSSNSNICSFTYSFGIIGSNGPNIDDLANVASI